VTGDPVGDSVGYSVITGELCGDGAVALGFPVKGDPVGASLGLILGESLGEPEGASLGDPVVVSNDSVPCTASCGASL
jgi:hypothetical protein